MPKQKRDYEAIRKEFMSSKYTDVKQFIEDRGTRYNATRAKNTKGWAKEKKAIKVRASENSLKRAEDKLAKQLEPSTEFLLGNIKKAIELSGRKLEQMEEKDSINVKDLNTIRGMNRIQNNQPTTYVKEESDVKQQIQLASIEVIIGPEPIDSSKDNENNA